MKQALRSTVFFQKALGSLIGGLIGDAIGTPTENMRYPEIEKQFGWVADFQCDGTDDTVMKYLLAEALIRTQGYATYDDWAQVWLDQWDDIFGVKVNKFFQSVLHTAVKLRRHCIPRMAALGNMPSSSSAMCIAPVGIASVDSILDAALNAVVPVSGEEMLELITNALTTASETKDYRTFRQTVYANEGHFFRRIACDSRETVPMTLALFRLAEGNVEKMVTYGANFGRDADTISTMGGAIAGAYQGIKAIRSDWVQKARQFTSVDQDELAERLVITARAKFDSQELVRQGFTAIL